MKATELMINDWIYSGIKKSPVILKPSDYRAMIEQPDKVFDDDGNFIWLKPIPLTEEILNANGFERRGAISTNANHNIDIQHWGEEEMFLNSASETGVPIMIPFTYVHELQRALRCCGLWDLANNFKLK